MDSTSDTNSLKKILSERPYMAGPASKNIHSQIHDLVDETRKEFGETAKKGPGSFGFYLGFFKRVGAHDIYRIRSEVRQSNCDDPKKLFWWKIGKLLKERKEKKVDN